MSELIEKAIVKSEQQSCCTLDPVLVQKDVMRCFKSGRDELVAYDDMSVPLT